MFSLLRRLPLALLLACTLCTAQPPEPQNIDALKGELHAFHDNGYNARLSAVAADAIQWLQLRTKAAKTSERLTAVFDIDETLLSTWDYVLATDFAYNETTCDAYLKEANLPAIEPIKQVFLTARKLGVEVVIITGRRELMRSCTVENLQKVGCGDYAALIFRPEDSKGTILAFKSNERRKLTAAGRTIILTIGDQRSDLDGGSAERLFKLPNPFYYIR